MAGDRRAGHRLGAHHIAPEAVARAAVAGHLAGRAVVIPGAANRAAVIAARLISARCENSVAVAPGQTAVTTTPWGRASS
jgi:hypothetical protein